jgi:hypothetical protein
MTFKSEITTAVIAVLAAGLMFTSCGKNEAKATKISDANTKTASVSESATESEEPDGEYFELPEEASEDFDYVTEVSGELFPDAKGKKMYGYEGLFEIETDNGKKDCYVFEFYTYRSKAKIYSKIAEIAKDSESSDIYLYNEETGSYEFTEVPQEELGWHDKATAALAVNAQQTAKEIPEEATTEE